MDQSEAAVVQVRLFVGGLSSEVSSVDLTERFTPLGNVLNVSTPPAKYGSGPHRGFAYVDFLPTSEASLRKLFSAYNGCKWRGGILRIEVAKEHYIDKLQKEWAADAEAAAAKEAELLRAKDDVPAMPVAKQAKSWPLLLLEQPEKPDKWKKKRDFEHSAEGDGIKIFFPRLKKVKNVPSKGLGKHKRSFQRVESLPLQQLSTCDCDESLRTGSCDCSSNKPAAEDAHDDLLISGEDDPISLAISKERQRQLDLLNKLFPSDSPRNSKPALELATSTANNGTEFKKAVPRVDKDAQRELSAHDSEKRAYALKTSSSQFRNGGDSVPVMEKDSLRAVSEPDKGKVSEPEEVSPAIGKGEERSEVQADEPEMWVSFMDTMPLPAKTEDNVSEFDLDELTLMMSEEEGESEEDEEDVEAIPDAPRKKAKRKKKKSKKSKQISQTEQDSIRAEESDIKPKTLAASPSTLTDSEKLRISSSEDVSRADECGPLHAEGSKEHEGVPLTSHVVIESLRSDERKSFVQCTRTESPKDETGSSDDESNDIPPYVDDRDTFFAGISSCDEGFDSEVDEGELWVSGVDEVQRPPTYVDPQDTSPKEMYPESKTGRMGSIIPSIEDEVDDGSFGQGAAKASASANKGKTESSKPGMSRHATDVPSTNDEESDEGEELSVSARSGDSRESADDEHEVWVSSLEPGGKEETSEELDSGNEEEKPELWVSGLENTSALPEKMEESSKLDFSKGLTTGKGYEKPSTAAVALEPTSSNSGAKVHKDNTLEVNLKEEKSTRPVAVAPLISEVQGEVAEDFPANEVHAPKRNELTRATWKALVGETGRVVFSLQQVLGGKSGLRNPETDQPPAAEDTHLEEKCGVNEVAEERTVLNDSPLTTQPNEMKTGSKNTPKTSVNPRKVLEEDSAPLIPTFADSSICPFMKSPDAEKEWLATKSDLRTDYRSKRKQAVKKSRKLRGR